MPPPLKERLKQAAARRVSCFYRQAFKIASQVAREARAQGDLESELRALWEMLDSGKIVHPEKKNLLYRAGLRTLKLACQLKDPSFGAEARVRWAALYRTLGKHEEAVRALKECLRLKELGRDLELRGYALWNLAFAFRMGLKLRCSRRKFLEAKKIFAKLRDSSGVAYALCGLAATTRLLGDPSKSVSFYHQALRFFKKDGDLYGIAYANCGVGNGLRKSGNFKKAIVHYNRSQRLYRKLGDQINEGYVLWGRAQCLRALGKSKKAFCDITQAKRRFDQTQDPRGLALASVFFNRQATQNDKAVFREAQLS